ncbi:MAG: hypothetical protein NVS9B12_06130 [Vulcanimicrobiaceae bacterium]
MKKRQRIALDFWLAADDFMPVLSEGRASPPFAQKSEFVEAPLLKFR